MGKPWKKNLLEALSREHKCPPPSVVPPPYGHQCAVCGKPVTKGHPIHRAERPQRSEVTLVSTPPGSARGWALYAPNSVVDTLRERC